MTDQITFSPHYPVLLAEIKQRIQQGQARAILAVNQELLALYWDIGRLIDARQKQQGWGTGVIPRLARDLHNALPEEKGFSERNIKLMVQFFREYPTLYVSPAIGQPAVAQIPWAHNVLLMQSLKDPAVRQWYAEATLAHGWSRSLLYMQIESAVHARQGKATSNFALRLPPPQSDLARQALKDPYLFDFLTLAEPFHERELETGLILCQQQNEVIAEYALRGVDKPIGVSTFDLTRSLPKELASMLPSIEQIERELADLP